MKDKDDSKTADLFPTDPTRKRGRPATGQALSAAERSKRYRERRKAEEKPSAQAAPPLSLSEREELEQLREITEKLHILVTRYEKDTARHAEEHRALYDQITRHMQTEARLNQIIESQNRRIAELESKRSRKPRR